MLPTYLKRVLPVADQQSDELASALKRLVIATVESAKRQGAESPQLPLHYPEPGRSPALDNSRYLDWAREIYSVRRLRPKHLPDIFSEPAWDLILDLYIAFLEGRKVSTKSACIGASSPTATALRKIQELEAAGLIYRVDDLHDKRLKWIALSKEAIWAMNHLCEDALNLRRRTQR